MHNLIWYWPEFPGLPRLGQPVLICVRTGLPRAQARSEARGVLRRVLAAWSHLPADELPLKETLRGPVWDGLFQGEALDLSLSYEEGEAWIGIRRGGFIGVDVMRLEPVPEAEVIAQHYFGPAECAALRDSPDSVRAFAEAWTRLEARCKCLKRGLTEWPQTAALQTQRCTVQSRILQERLVLGVAIAPQLPPQAEQDATAGRQV
jgi:4'-phosphopantetheinyl transferase